METGRQDDIVYGTFQEGVELRAAYTKLMGEHGIEAGIVLSGIGMLKDPTLGYFVGDGEYERETVEGRFELLSTQGNLATADEGPFPHLHVTLGGDDHDAFGGHLFEATVEVGHEFAVRVLSEGSLVREHDPATGLEGLKPR